MSYQDSASLSEFKPHNTKIFFVGISGIGMSSLAILSKKHGYTVMGSCDKANKISSILESHGINVIYGHKGEHIDGFDVICFSTAIKDDNPEKLYAIQNGLRIMHRSEVLDILTRDTEVIGVMGSHGKTTISSMTSVVANGVKKINAYIGGIVPEFGWNGTFDKDAVYTVVEMDESDGSFVNLHYSSIILNNIDTDHLESYNGSMDVMVQTIIDFLKNNCIGTPKIALNIDDKYIYEDILPNIKDFVKERGGSLVTFGRDRSANFMFSNVKQDMDGSSFDLSFNGKFVQRVKIPLYGEHNTANTVGSLSLCSFMDINLDKSINLVSKFGGVDRRFSLIHVNPDLVFVDDYAHHQSELSAFLNSIKLFADDNGFNRILCFFQPHRYSRIGAAIEEYAEVLGSILDSDKGDIIFVTPIYSAEEEEIKGVNSEILVQMSNERSKSDKKDLVRYLSDGQLKNLESFIKENAQINDVIAFIGAGSISDIGRSVHFKSIIEYLREKSES